MTLPEPRAILPCLSPPVALPDARSPFEEVVLSRRSPERSDVETLLRFWLPALAYVGLVLWLGAQPHLQSPLHFWNSDKVMHLFEYGPLGWLFARALGATLSVRAPRLVALLAVVL